MDTVRRRLLVVDDDESMRALLARWLAPRYALELRASGPEALAQIEAEPPDLLLLDLRMPGMDGWELLERLEAQGCRLPVVIMSADLRRPWPASSLVKARWEKGRDLSELYAACADALAGPARAAD